MRISLDTNRYTDFQRGNTVVRQVLEAAMEICVPFATVDELRAGFAGGSRGAENEKWFQLFLSRPGVRVLYPDDGTTRQYATLYQQLKAQGTPVPTNDIWIAALTLQHGVTLYSRDAHFDHIPQLPRV